MGAGDHLVKRKTEGISFAYSNGDVLLPRVSGLPGKGEGIGRG